MAEPDPDKAGLESPPRTRKRGLAPLFVLGLLLYVLGNVQRAAIPGSVFDELQALYSLSTPQVTSLGAAFMYVYAAMQLVAGLLADRYGGARVLLAGGLVFTAGSFLFPLADSFPLLCLARVLCGAGMSTFYLSLAAMSIEAFPTHYATAVTVCIMIGYLGGCLANGPLLGFVHAYGLRTALLAVAAAAAAGTALFGALLPRVRLPEIRAVSLSPRKFGRILASGPNRALILFCAVNWAAFYGVQTVTGKKFLADFCGMSSLSAAWTISLMGVLSAVSGVLIALVLRLLPGRQPEFCRGIAILMTALGLVLAGLTGFDLPCTLPAGLFCAMALCSSLSAVTIPIYKVNNRPEDIVAALALSNMSCYLAVALFGTFAGHLVDLVPPVEKDGALVYTARSWALVFIPMAAASLAGLAAAWRIQRLKGTPRHG